MDGRWEQEEGDEERGKKKMTCGVRVSVTGEMKYTSSYTPAAGPDYVHTYSVAYLWETKNYNGMLKNRRIIMMFFRNDKVIIAQIQLTLFYMVLAHEDYTGTCILLKDICLDGT